MTAVNRLTDLYAQCELVSEPFESSVPVRPSSCHALVEYPWPPSPNHSDSDGPFSSSLGAVDALTTEGCCCIGAKGPDLWSRQGGTAISMYASHVSATERTKLLRQLEEGTCRTHLVVQLSMELSETVRADRNKTAQACQGSFLGVRSGRHPQYST